MRKFTVPLLITILFFILVGLAYYDKIDLYTQSVLMFMGINIIFGSSLNIVNGYMGEFSCGHAGFMAVGAYVSSVLSVLFFAQDRVFGAPLLPPEYAIYGFPIIIIISFIAAALTGLLVALPSFKTRGDYLAIITIAANYIIISTIINLDVIGGPRGFMGMKNVIFAMEDVVFLPWMLIWVYVFTILSLWAMYRFVSSTYGKGIVAIHQDEVAAEIMSVNTNKMKLVAFMFSSGLAGVSGALFAHVLGYVNPNSFNILKSTEALVMVYLGGMGSLTGSILAAISFTFLLELLRPLQIIKWVVIPLLLIILMQFRPEGIMGNRELSDIFPKLRKFYQFK
ncbi:amino acid/amide ABC transporter membrane protein 2, HAAT family (TC 3.A.1.4.-) [Desulfonauticus submarinus]|uniref:Amino acid/amide ABC transporter membrane protein 2, HAAT family (TC 3.A.1.4.-) n=1 Tax=Desulfonauticus submarinus TaxID=206665 RepID=A0A1H0D2S6_9BACT|nr:branched-chain amino acid ABC transporter permease [Desulfonauticus submarinus]SDN64457.1 amino acid/amide ABC transporter membrane protein 2, HAAT family (TC 3.A.1.4.-) [Desulfonauticus submarinus]